MAQLDVIDEDIARVKEVGNRRRMPYDFSEVKWFFIGGVTR